MNTRSVKIKGEDDDSALNTQSVKRRREDDAGSEITKDRLSQLPQPVLRNILSLLSQKDAIRTSVLSKSWRYLWHGRLNVEFREFCFARKNNFWSFLDKTLQRYLDQNLSLQKFLVYIFHYDVDLVLLQKWIPVLIINMGIKSLNVLFCMNGIAFPLPLVVFQSESLVELHLQHLNLNTLQSTDNVMLKNLQTLRLHSVYITDEIFDKIISGCPLIENLDLLFCSGLKSIKLSKHYNIKNFACTAHNEITVEIENPQTLESFRIQNCRDWFLRYKNTYFPHLKSLNLHSVKLPAKTFDNFSSLFPCLNELILDSCRDLKDLWLFSSSIKRLIIRIDRINPGKSIKAFIDTPNILYFEYSGYGFLPLIKFTTTSHEWASDISVWYKLKPSDNDSTIWFLKLNKLLEALSQSHITLHLIPNKYKKLHINDSYGCFYEPVVVEHLRLSGYFPFSIIRAILICYFRVCRPRYISMDQHTNELSQFICYLIPNNTGWGYSWLQDLEEVSVEVYDYKAEKWNCFRGTILPELPIPQRYRFRLTWREQLSNIPS
ncbi:hypothetical protein CASFOL_021870 [Castilleja foliolosa]|uniref:F-box domain-containing protein n=1 Tax=Castilleja foliolosa TaxID=1961234 RepID=A0ABD3CZW6_9LAMI